MEPEPNSLHTRDLATGLRCFTQKLNMVGSRNTCEESQEHLVNPLHHQGSRNLWSLL